MAEEQFNIFDVTINENAKGHLLETTRWTKFLAILMFILIGIMILGLVAILATDSMAAVMSQGFAAMGTIGASLVALLIVALYWYPTYMLYRFSICIKSGITQNDQQLIETGFRCQKNMYRFAGVLTILILCIYLAIIVAAVVSVL
jgi:glucan phosphoethanolaminetransferase (alkaline phosphatase superfamily)